MYSAVPHLQVPRSSALVVLLSDEKLYPKLQGTTNVEYWYLYRYLVLVYFDKCSSDYDGLAEAQPLRVYWNELSSRV